MVLTSCNQFLAKCGRCEYSFKGNSEKSVKMVMRLHRKKCEVSSADEEIEFKTTSFSSTYHKDSNHSIKDYQHIKHDWQSFSNEYTTFTQPQLEKEIEKINTRHGLVK